MLADNCDQMKGMSQQIITQWNTFTNKTVDSISLHLCKTYMKFIYVFLIRTVSLKKTVLPNLNLCQLL